MAVKETEKVTLQLDGANIESSQTAAIAILSGDEASIELVPGSTNTLANSSSASTTTEAESPQPKAVIHSKIDLSIHGEGELNITAQYNDGISSSDGLVIDSGNISITAADDGIRGKDYLVVNGGNLQIEATGHALKSDNTEEFDRGYVSLQGGQLNLKSAAQDGINAQYVLVGGNAKTTISVADDGIHADIALVIDGTTSLDIENSEEGLEAGVIIIAAGDIRVKAKDDAINASDGSTHGHPEAGSISGVELLIGGGHIYLNSEIGDGIDSNGSINISGGTITVDGPSGSGPEGVLDTSGDFQITGGTLLAGGSSGMAETPKADSAQGWVAGVFTAKAGQEVTISNAAGKELLKYTPQKDISYLFASAAHIINGEEYRYTIADGQPVTVIAGKGVERAAPPKGGMEPLGNGTRPSPPESENRSLSRPQLSPREAAAAQ